MQKTAHSFTKTEVTFSLADLERYAKGWLLDSEIRQLSPGTISNRKLIIEKLLWFFKQKELSCCGTLELRQFLAYVSNGHEDAEGRWGNARLTKHVRPGTASMYFARLRTFFRFLVAEDIIEFSPMEKMRPPINRPDQIQPFTPEQVLALQRSAKKSEHPRRDEAICLFLLDTGVRASELCGLRMSNMDLQGRRATVVGKGNKTRAVYFGRDTTKALWQYLKETPREGDEALFTSDRGTRAGEALTRSGLLQLIMRLGKSAKIEATRCSPHTFRHSFAVEFLRAGGNLFTLQTLLGHTSLAMSRRYTALAQADLEKQHREFSPVDRMKGSKK